MLLFSESPIHTNENEEAGDLSEHGSNEEMFSSPPAKSLTPEVTVIQETLAGPTPSPPPPRPRPNPTIVVVDHEGNMKQHGLSGNNNNNSWIDGGMLPQNIKGKPVAGRKGVLLLHCSNEWVK